MGDEWSMSGRRVGDYFGSLKNFEIQFFHFEGNLNDIHNLTFQSAQTDFRISNINRGMIIYSHFVYKM